MNADHEEGGEQHLDRLRARRPGAVERWFREHADAVYTFVYYRVGRNPELAAEAVQETFLAALRRIEDFDPRRGAMLAWLTTLSRNCIRSVLRQRGRYRTDAGDPWERIDAALLNAWHRLDRAPLPDEVLERRETSELVQMALAHLPGEYRHALRERYFENRSLREIASGRGATTSAVKSLLHRARQAFRTAFETIAESLHELPPEGRATP